MAKHKLVVVMGAYFYFIKIMNFNLVNTNTPPTPLQILEV